MKIVLKITNDLSKAFREKIKT